MLGTITHNPNLVVRHTQTARGRGVFTRQAYLAGAVVEISPVVELDAPFEALPLQVQRIVFCWGKAAGAAGHPDYAIVLGVGSIFNHSANPNLAYAPNTDRQALVFTALRDIDAEEELTIDYNADLAPGDADWFEAVGVGRID